jgi:hypothetical protein
MYLQNNNHIPKDIKTIMDDVRIVYGSNGSVCELESGLHFAEDLDLSEKAE